LPFPNEAPRLKIKIQANVARNLYLRFPYRLPTAQIAVKVPRTAKAKPKGGRKRCRKTAETPVAAPAKREAITFI
jgi:hypothetical protein